MKSKRLSFSFKVFDLDDTASADLDSVNKIMDDYTAVRAKLDQISKNLETQRQVDTEHSEGTIRTDFSDPRRSFQTSLPEHF